MAVETREREAAAVALEYWRNPGKTARKQIKIQFECGGAAHAEVKLWRGVQPAGRAVASALHRPHHEPVRVQESLGLRSIKVGNVLSSRYCVVTVVPALLGSKVKCR